MGHSLYKGTWKSSTLAAKFFEVSPKLVRTLPFWDVEVFSALVEGLSYKSYDVAAECLVLGRDILPHMGRDREVFLSLCRVLTEGPWREVKGCLEAYAKAVPAIEESQRSRFLRLAERLAKSGQRDIAAFILEGCRCLGSVNSSEQRYVLDLCESLLAVSPEAVPAFLKSLNVVLARVTLTQLDVWFQQGLKLLKENPDGGLAYFKLESNTSEQLLETLSSSLELDKVKGVMRLYCRALSGVPVEILSSKELAHKGIGWVSESQASTEGTKVFLPPVVDLYLSKEENFGWFKVVSTHQVAHLEFGSFNFVFEQPAPLFDDLRAGLEVDVVAAAASRMQDSLDGIEPAGEAIDGQDAVLGGVAIGPAGRGQPSPEDEGTAERGYLTDMGRFFHLFDGRRLALDVFTILEDGRLDYRVKSEYRGIVRDYRRVQAGALAERPSIEELPLRQAMVELLLRLSLEQLKGIPVPTEHRDTARVLAKIFRRMLNVEATVEDTAEATIRVYQILSRLPNEELTPQDFQPQDFDDQEEFSEEELEDLLQQLQDGQGEPTEGEESEESYESPEEVEFRGDFKPELVQLLNRLRMDQSQQGEGEEEPITKEMLESLLRENPELDLDAEAGRLQTAMGLFAQNIMKEAGYRPPPRSPARAGDQ